MTSMRSGARLSGAVLTERMIAALRWTRAFPGDDRERIAQKYGVKRSELETWIRARRGRGLEADGLSEAELMATKYAQQETRRK